MVDLRAISPLDDLLPFSSGGTTLSQAAPAFITSLMPVKGKENALSAALKTGHDVALPSVGRSTGRAALKVVWTGLGQYFLVGEEPASEAIAEFAALTDQSHGWAVMRLEGPDAARVLARVCPLDTRPGVFRRGHTARTELAHMMAVVTRTAKGFEIMVMRSFAKTAVESLSDAMGSVEAQNSC